jgi:hypothetical protein
VSTHAADDAVVPDAPADVVRVLEEAPFDDEPRLHAAATTLAPRPAKSPHRLAAAEKVTSVSHA